MKKIAINEIFHSIQGEGPYAGRPSIFIRFHGCQLRCPWCDTGKALNPHDPHAEMTAQKILEEISVWKCKHVVITGGDPSFQLEGLDILSEQLVDNGYTLEMETSGIKIIPTFICKRFEQINIGLKLPNVAQQFRMNYYRAAAEHFQHMDNAIFKIVITCKDDVEFLRENLLNSGLIQRDKIFLMPLGDTVDQQNENANYVIDLCIREGFRFSPRLHIMFGVQ